MPFTEDLTEFFETADFAVEATFDGNTIKGIFADEYEEDVEVEGSAPIFWTRTVDVPSVAHGDTLTISGTIYKIRNVQPDGTGVTALRLEEPE